MTFSRHCYSLNQKRFFAVKIFSDFRELCSSMMEVVITKFLMRSRLFDGTQMTDWRRRYHELPYNVFFTCVPVGRDIALFLVESSRCWTLSCCRLGKGQSHNIFYLIKAFLKSAKLELLWSALTPPCSNMHILDLFDLWPLESFRGLVPYSL